MDTLQALGVFSLCSLTFLKATCNGVCSACRCELFISLTGQALKAKFVSAVNLFLDKGLKLSLAECFEVRLETLSNLGFLLLGQ